MGLISVIWGIVALLWMLLAFIPLLGWGNWFMIPFAVVGALLAAVALLLTRSGHRSRAKLGFILNVVAIVVGAIRLSLGGGIL